MTFPIDYFCSQNQSVRLKEMGVPQKAKHSWVYDTLNERWDISILQVEAHGLLAVSQKRLPKVRKIKGKLVSVPHDWIKPDYYSAFTVEELFKMMPMDTSLTKGSSEYHCRFYICNRVDWPLKGNDTIAHHHTESHLTPAIALANMLIYLIKYSIVNLKK